MVGKKFKKEEYVMTHEKYKISMFVLKRKGDSLIPAYPSVKPKPGWEGWELPLGAPTSWRENLSHP